jgi:hypothetical protein
MNPMAFWKRSEAVQHGFESVRTTIEQNYEALKEVFSQYGLEMDQATARRRAARARAAIGWEKVDTGEASIEDRPLRLVGGGHP